MNIPLQSAVDFFTSVGFIVGALVVIFLVVILFVVLSWYKKVPQGKALVRTGMGGAKVSFTGIVVIPVVHRMEMMDISLKKVEIGRTGKEGLICKDNMRADIKVVFFVRVNPSVEDVKNVAKSIGPERASREETLNQLFEAKFSEALKTVGKQFDFVELYDARERFRKEILQTIGTNLNGYLLDDAAIDYLEQTPVELLNADNILDAEGIKKITELTAVEHMAANKIRRAEEKEIKKQDVEAREAILTLERQLAEKEEVQKREIANIKARETAEAAKVSAEEFKRSETARILSEEEIQIAEENKQRQVIVAQKAKERTEKVESERVMKDKELEQNERERIVSLAQIEKEKALEEERKNIQEVIRERVVVEKATVSEEEKIKDTRAFAEAERERTVAVTLADKAAEEEKIKRVKLAEAEKNAAEIKAKQRIIEADTALTASEREAAAKIKMAEARAAEEAALGIAEAQVIEAKALAKERDGESQAKVLLQLAEAQSKEIELHAIANEQAGIKDANVNEQKALAEARGKEALAEAIEKTGLAEAKVIEEKLAADAIGIEKKAEAMKKLDGVGRDHEEFKIRLDKETEVRLAQINIQEEIAKSQASVLAEALKNAKIDIVGGEAVFFDKLINSITRGKAIDGLVNSSDVLSEVKENLLNAEGGNVLEKIRGLISQLGMSSEDVRNLSVAALILKLTDKTDDSGIKGVLAQLLNSAWQAGIADKPAGSLGL